MYFKPKILKELHKSNKLKKVIKILKEECKIDNAKFGTQVATYRLNNEKNYVYKLSPVDIGYFKTRKNNKPVDLMKDSKKMNYFYIPIENIIYEDKNVFLYSQKYIKKLEVLNPYCILSIVMIIYKMITEDLLCTDIGIHNLGYDGENVLLFDLQGIKTYNDACLNRLEINLSKYLKILSIKSPILGSNKTDTLTNIKNIYHEIYDKYYNTFTSQNKNLIDFKSNLISI